jgi:hypothetical protein
MTYLKNRTAATAVIRGLTIAHTKMSAAQAGLLGADIKNGSIVVKEFTDTQAAQLAGTSPSTLRLAMQISDIPALRDPVEKGEMSLAKAVELLQRLQRLQSQPKQPEKQPASALLEEFADLSPAERKMCKRARLVEALLDASTAPSSKPNGMFAQH